jgi:Na+/H+-translocating membrane pyrophosphatase
MLIGFISEYFTSNSYGPTLKLVKAFSNGPFPNIIQGPALGYMSTKAILCITAIIAYLFAVAGMCGIVLAVLGML